MATNGTPEQPEQPEAQGEQPVQPTAQDGQPEQPRAQSPQPAGGLFGVPKMWLLIGGGAGGGVLVIAIVVVVLLVSGVIGGGNPQPSSVLDLVPDDAEFMTRIDVQRILGNDFLADEMEFDDALEEFEDLGMSPEDLLEMAIVIWDGGEVVILKGNFDLDYIRDELEDDDGEEDSYRGYEVWESPDNTAGVLLDGYIVFSDYGVDSLENVLRMLYNGSGSLGQADEDNEMNQILEKLGDAYVEVATVGDTCRVDRCEGFGWALTEVDESAEESTVEIALLFRNERSAERAADDYDEVADFLERDQGFDIEDTKAEGLFVVGVAIEDASEEEEEREAPIRQEPEATAAPATQTPQPIVSREDWINDCYDNSSDLGSNDCACVHDRIQINGSPVPQFDSRWEDGRGSAIGVEAYNYCY